jgi:hypothetical protein
MAERHIHHLTDDFYRITRALIEAKTYNGIHSFGVTFIAYVVTIQTSGLAELTLVTYVALHQDILLKVLQRGLTYQAFFFHFR